MGIINTRKNSKLSTSNSFTIYREGQGKQPKIQDRFGQIIPQQSWSEIGRTRGGFPCSRSGELDGGSFETFLQNVSSFAPLSSSNFAEQRQHSPEDIMRKIAKDDPNSQFAASVFEFIFSPFRHPLPRPVGRYLSIFKVRFVRISVVSTSVCSPIRGLRFKRYFFNIGPDCHSCSQT